MRSDRCLLVALFARLFAVGGETSQSDVRGPADPIMTFLRRGVRQVSYIRRLVAGRKVITPPVPVARAARRAMRLKTPWCLRAIRRFTSLSQAGGQGPRKGFEFATSMRFLGHRFELSDTGMMKSTCRDPRRARGDGGLLLFRWNTWFVENLLDYRKAGRIHSRLFSKGSFCVIRDQLITFL